MGINDGRNMLKVIERINISLLWHLVGSITYSNDARSHEHKKLYSIVCVLIIPFVGVIFNVLCRVACRVVTLTPQPLLVPRSKIE
jgi:hypothetical protein